jgi:hypothetical protein
MGVIWALDDVSKSVPALIATGVMLPFATTRSESNFIRAPARWPTRSMMDCRLCNADNEMTIAFDLLQQHIQTLVDDNARWQTLMASEEHEPSPA